MGGYQNPHYDVAVVGEDEHGEFRPLVSLPGRYLATEVAGGFTGRVGMYAVAGDAAFDWFEYEPVDETS